MHKYDRKLMKRAKAARKLVEDGEDPLDMLLAAVWPDHDWSESALYAHLTSCPRCRGANAGCSECGDTGLVTSARKKLVAIEELASGAFAESQEASS